MNQKAQILVVDDDREMKLLLRDFLVRQGYTVATAASAEAALRWFHQLPPNFVPLVVSDIKMGSTSGIDLTKKLLLSYPELHVILMSAFETESTKDEALKSGARRFLRKPFSLVEMAKAVGEELKKS